VAFPMYPDDKPPHHYVYAINDRQNIVRGRYAGRRRGHHVAIVDARGVVRTFHPRYVGVDWGAYFDAFNASR